MNSLREFISKGLVPAIEDDAKRFRIFNEADLQYRAAYHLDRKFVSASSRSHIVNEPLIRIGKGRGAASAKLDLVIVHKDDGPLAAIELKCLLDSEGLTAAKIASRVWEDIENLRKFKQRFGYRLDSFAIVLVDLPDAQEFSNLQKVLRKERLPWMAHYLHIHVTNMFCQSFGVALPAVRQQGVAPAIVGFDFFLRP